MAARENGWEVMLPIVKQAIAGQGITDLSLEHRVAENTIRRYRKMYLAGKCPIEPTTASVARAFVESKAPPRNTPPPKSTTPQSDGVRPAKLLFLDVETLPNLGLFFDTYSERSIPLDFILKPKALCTIAYKFSGDEKATVLCTATPYDDRPILEQLLPVVEKAHYVVWHYGEGFDRPFIDGRLLLNGLPALPPVNSIDTYKLARQKFGRTLNSNKLDHLGELLGVGRKNKTDASLWVRCARGEPAALEEMSLYNAQDVDLLEAVYHKLAPNIKTKVNHNLLHDDPVNRCKPCGSTNLELKGYELVNATFRHRYQCRDCSAWSTFPKKAAKK